MMCNQADHKGRMKSGSTLPMLIFAAVIAATASAPMELNSNQQEGDGAEAQEAGKLRVITITNEKIEGEYYSPTSGIHFQSEVKGDYHLLSITTIDGQTLVIAKQFHESTSLVRITETDFLIMNSRDDDGHFKYTDYVVPGTYHDRVETALKRNRLSGKVLRHLDNRNINETRQLAFESLALRDEIELITEAAWTLGRLGINGNENPAAMPFYTLARRLQQYRDSLLNPADGIGMDHPIPALSDRKKRWQPALSYVTVERRSSECVGGIVPSTSNDCLGMCGYGCYCWSWVCGDCCVHQGCLDHDNCCREHGFWSWACWSLWNFSCSSYSC